MLVYPVFEGDDNQTLAWVQHNAYWKLIGSFFRYAADHYLNDIRYTWESPDFINIIRKTESFDHRVLQDAHDMVAAYYRFILAPHQDHLEITEGFDIKSYYLAAWEAYYHQEISLLSQVEEFSEAIVTAVAFQNTERGYAAEAKLREFLLQRYKAMVPVVGNADI